MFINRAVPLDCGIDEASFFYEKRLENDADVASYIPETLISGSDELYDRFFAAESAISNNGDYLQGSARRDDDTRLTPGNGKVLLTAEHATDHQRTRPGESEVYIKKRDFGTGGITELAAIATDNDALIAIGRQTGDPNRDQGCRFKQQMLEVINAKNTAAHLAVHGMGRALATHIRDERGYAIQLGIGPRPSDATRTLVYDYLIKDALELGLKAGVNQPHLRFKNKKPVLTADGKRIETLVFAGSGEMKGPGETTRDYSQWIAQEAGRDDEFAAVQIELSSPLRAHPDTPFKSETDRRLGLYAGYLFAKLAAESATKL